MLQKDQMYCSYNSCIENYVCKYGLISNHGFLFKYFASNTYFHNWRYFWNSDIVRTFQYYYFAFFKAIFTIILYIILKQMSSPNDFNFLPLENSQCWIIQWVPFVRAAVNTFQYHYFTFLKPFLLLSFTSQYVKPFI